MLLLFRYAWNRRTHTKKIWQEISCSYITGKTYDYTIFFWCWLNDFITEERSETKTLYFIQFSTKTRWYKLPIFPVNKSLPLFFFSFIDFARWKRFSEHKRNRERKKIIRGKPLTHFWMHKYLVKINMSVDIMNHVIVHCNHFSYNIIYAICNIPIPIHILIVRLGYSVKHVFWILVQTHKRFAVWLMHTDTYRPRNQKKWRMKRVRKTTDKVTDWFLSVWVTL